MPLSAAKKPQSQIKHILPALEEKIMKAQELFKVPGCAIAIVEGNHLLYAKGFGKRSVDLEERITPYTIFQIGSVSKGFTATLIAKLMSEGKLDWNRTVKSYLPDFKLKNKKLTEKLTIKDILAQRSGLPSYAGDNAIQRGKYYLDALKIVRKAKPFAPIGKKFSYQNVLYCVSDQVIKKATGESWHNTMIKTLLRPTGMNYASTSLTDILKNPNTAKPHVTGRAGAIELPWSSFGYRVPCAGGLNMNIVDLSRYLMLHLNEGTLSGKRLIPANLIKEIHTPQVSTRGREPRSYRVYYHAKERAKKTAYGLGFRSCEWAGHQVIGHGGYVRGQLSSITMIPDKKIGIAILCNAASTLPSIIRAHFIDMSLGLKPIDWLERARIKKEKSDRIAKKRKLRKKRKKARLKRKAKAVKPKRKIVRKSKNK